MKKWEYKYIHLDDKDDSGEKILCNFGKMGWRVIHTVSGNGAIFSYLLEREIPEVRTDKDRDGGQGQ